MVRTDTKVLAMVRSDTKMSEEARTARGYQERYCHRDPMNAICGAVKAAHGTVRYA